MGSLPRAAVFAVALLLLASSGEAFFDLFNIFRPRSESDYFRNAFDGAQEQMVPEQTEQEEQGAAPATATGLTRVPPSGPPTKAAQDTVNLAVDDRAGPAGAWTIVSENSGVSAMHLAVMRHGKAIMFDTSTTGRSLMRLPQDNCRIDPRAKQQGTMDCWAHAVEFDYNTGGLRSLKIQTDTWCSSGAFDADGNLVQTGGYFEGEKAVRYLSPCDTCDWLEHPNSFAEGRWYATQHVLPDGRFIVFGGRRAFSYEFVPAPGQTNDKAVPMPLLRETTDDVENNLYPFVNLLPDGNLFVFANDRSVIFDPRTGKVVRELPKLAGGGRNYPASAMSALLPLDLRNASGDPEPEVIICGGALKTALKLGENNTFQPALRDCARINLARPDAQWETEDMPVGRVMGDMLILPTGDLLLLNGAAKGCSGWGFARQPILTPVLYSPQQPQGSRFRPLAASTIARMYHSTSAVLPDATVLVAGGNTNTAYNFSGVDFPTEVRVERFAPPYLSEELDANRPEIDAASVPADGMRYGAPFTFRFSTPSEAVGEADVKVTMYAPPFTTHGYSMNQRLLILPITGFADEGRSFAVTVDAPAKPELAPPGYYLVFVVAKDVPSIAAWVKIQ
ncbi:aldehyde oxidase GLOX1-like [Phragmites australis]|uniref:aldehyde oxidase GLOX1-like n=1 Tax=Phragmites australis TaxID=29695 RepID=UPI002D788E53|nr:aldehyde oxidase GLOX1-like [Phragmites australis]